MSIKVTQKGIENASLEHEKRQKLGRRSRNKGSNFERDIAKKFKAHYGFELVRTPQSGGFAKKSAKADDFRGDIVPADEDLVLNLHIEAKCHKTWDVPNWIRQAESDCPDGKIPVVVFHKNGTSKNYIVFPVGYLFQLLGSAPPTEIIEPTVLNNCVENLEYVSSGVNNQKSYDTGLKPKGENHYFAKLSDKDCFNIRLSHFLSGKSVIDLVKEYSISDTTVRRIVDSQDYRNPFNLYLLFKNSKSWSLPSWFAQAESDCPKGKKPCVIFHKHGTSKDYIALSLEDFFKLVPAENIAYLKSGGVVK